MNLLIMGGILVLVASTSFSAHSQTAIPTGVQVQEVACSCYPIKVGPHHSVPPPMGTTADPTSYDEQIGMTFTQSFTSMAYNVTAVEQSDPTSHQGPVYLLNGLSDMGYWYQVGLSWNWSPGQVPGTGFAMSYEVFDATGKSIYPTNGGGGLQAFSGPVHAYDSVLLNLYFSSTYGVVMLARDYNTGSTSSKTYSAEGGSEFIGLSSNTANSNGFFTGLMTEWYHSSPFYNNISPVRYTNPHFALISAWMWIDEFSCSDVSCSNRTTLFDAATSGPISYSNPTLLHEFSSNGATEYSNAYGLITGPAYWSMTVSFSVSGGGSGYGKPSFFYSYNGVSETAVLAQDPLAYVVDAGSNWSVNQTLPGSSQTERWAVASSASSGFATSSQTIDFDYQYQYQLVVTGGSGGSDGAGWYASGSMATAASFGVFGRSAGAGQRVVSYSVDGTSAQVSPTTGTIYVDVSMTTSHKVVFSSIDQYQVALSQGASEALNSITPPSIGGDNSWYDAGTPVRVVLNGIWSRSSGVGSRLISYSVNGGPTTTLNTLGNLTVLSLGSISSPQSIVATAVKQYALSTPTGVLSSVTDPSVPGDTGWYDSGTHISISYDSVWNLTAQQSRVVATEYRVNGGNITVLPGSESGVFTVALTMTSPQKIDVDSATQFYTSFVTTDASGSKRIDPTSLQIIVDGQTQEISGLNAWLDSGKSFIVSNLTYEGVNVTPTSQIHYSVLGPAVVTLKARIYDATLKVTDLLGLPVSGAQVRLKLANGTTVTGQTDGNGFFVAPSIPLGNFTGSVASLGQTSQIAGDASKGAATEARVLLSIPVLAFLAGLVAIAVGLSIYVLRTRSKRLASGRLAVKRDSFVSAGHLREVSHTTSTTTSRENSSKRSGSPRLTRTSKSCISMWNPNLSLNPSRN
jgi:hypothetical protein